MTNADLKALRETAEELVRLARIMNHMIQKLTNGS
jgi:hypothetical protein